MQKIESYLSRLLLCSRIRELAVLPQPVTVADLGFLHGLFSGIVWVFYGRGSGSRSKFNILVRILIFPSVVILLRIILFLRRMFRFKQRKPSWGNSAKRVYSFSILRDVYNVFRIGYWRIRYGITASSEVKGFVTDTDREVSLIRTCILLRVFGSYGIAVELLIQRFNSGLPVDQTRQWLSFLLKEIGDTGAASEIFSSKEEIDKQKESTKAPLTIPKQTKLKYGVVMLSMFDSEVFRSSLTSLKNSGFPGEIVVVEDGYHKGRNCEDFCRQMLVKYVKSAVWVGESGAANLGIEQFDKDTDIVVYSHSDVLWPKNWFGHFNHIWERVYDQNKVGILNLGYLQCKSNVDAALYKLFVDCKYDELVDILLTIKDIPVLADYVQNLQIKNGYENFGFTLDPWNNNSTKLRTMTGRFSPVASFLMQTWQNIGKFDPNMSVGMDLELQYDGLKNHRWNLWTNNAPIVHFVSGDTISIAKQDQKKRMEMINTTSKLFQEKYGIGADHFFSTYFAGTSVIFADEIVKKANEWRFADIDFIFDDFFERLKR